MVVDKRALVNYKLGATRSFSRRGVTIPKTTYVKSFNFNKQVYVEWLEIGQKFQSTGSCKQSLECLNLLST